MGGTQAVGTGVAAADDDDVLVRRQYIELAIEVVSGVALVLGR